MKRLIIAGSRDLKVSHDRMYSDIDLAMRAWWELGRWEWADLEIVSGVAKGIDACGESLAMTNKVALKRFPAEWAKYGKPAGHMRNRQMAEYADGALVYVREPTPGSSNMATWMLLLGKPVYVLKVK